MTPVNNVAVVNRSTLPDAEVALMVEGYRDELRPLCDAWNLPVPGLVFYGASHLQSVLEEAAVFVVDSADEPDAFGYHTALGVAVFGYVDVQLCRSYDEPVSRVFGHELFELVVDPDVDRWVGPLPDGSHVPVEVCDPVQRDSGAKRVVDPLLGEATVQIADWIGPDWFQPGATVTSHWGTQLSALTDARGGYHVWEEASGVIMTKGALLKPHGRTIRRVASRAVL